ncbi:MAG: HMA2 domain-containing protein [Rhodosalinus sp.]
MVNCVHHIPGRARFKIEALRRDPELMALIERQVGSLEGVKTVEINRHAASIVVHYCTERGAIDAIMDHICAHCPRAQLNRRASRETALPPVPIRPASRARPPVVSAMRDAAGKALLKALIEQAFERGITGTVRI